MKKLLLILLALTMALTVPAQKSKSRQTKQKQTTATTKKKQSAARSTKKQPTKAELQARQKKLREEQAAAQRRQQELQRQVASKLQDAQALASEIEDKQVLIDSIQKDVAALDKSIAELDQQLKQLQKELNERRDHYAQSVRYMYRNRKSQNQMMFVLSAKDFNQMYRRMRFSDDYATYQKAQGEAIKLKQGQVDKKQQELRGVKKEKSDLLARCEKEQSRLEAKRAEEQKIVASLRKEQKTVQNLMEQQRKEEAALNNSIQKIIEEEQARARAAAEAEARRKAEAEARRQAERDKANGSNTAQNGKGKKSDKASATSQKPTKPEKYTEPSADRQLSGSFVSNKGRMPYPITGPYIVVRGVGNYTIEKVTLPSKSLYLKGQPGAKARCIFDGVVTGIVDRGKDLVILVRHGRYISVYSNVAKASVKMGETVKTNQILGTLGADNSLLFQLRNWTEPLNPKHWLKK